MLIIIKTISAGEVTPKTSNASGIPKNPLLEKIEQNLNIPRFLALKSTTSCESSP